MPGQQIGGLQGHYGFIIAGTNGSHHFLDLYEAGKIGDALIEAEGIAKLLFVVVKGEVDGFARRRCFGKRGWP